MPDALTNDLDFDLVRRVVAGEVNAFRPLLEHYQDFVVKIVSRHIPREQVGEVAHDTFVRAYFSLPTFKFKTTFRQWISSIAVRTCCDFWRKSYRSRELPMSSLAEEDQQWIERVSSTRSAAELDECAARQEAQELLAWALDRLSPEDRMVLELVHLEGHSVRETAKLLGWSVANVKVRAFRSRKKLRALLENVPGGQEGKKNGAKI